MKLLIIDSTKQADFIQGCVEEGAEKMRVLVNIDTGNVFANLYDAGFLLGIQLKTREHILAHHRNELVTIMVPAKDPTIEEPKKLVYVSNHMLNLMVSHSALMLNDTSNAMKDYLVNCQTSCGGISLNGSSHWVTNATVAFQ